MIHIHLSASYVKDKSYISLVEEILALFNIYYKEVYGTHLINKVWLCVTLKE